MKRILLFLLTSLLAISIVSGCKKMPTVDKSLKPGECFSQYDKLTHLYGKPWQQALKELGISMQELDAEGLNYLGVPLQENYAGISFKTALRFGGEDNSLIGVEYTASYNYPEEEEKLLRDLVMINHELIADFGKSSDSSLVFNWAEKILGEKWNRDIAYWQDMQILKRLLDADYDGTLLRWNLSSVAEENVQKTRTEHFMSVGISIDREADIAVITIGY